MRGMGKSPHFPRRFATPFRQLRVLNVNAVRYLDFVVMSVIREYVIIRDNSGVGFNYPGESWPLALTSLAHPIITGAWNLYHV